MDMYGKDIQMPVVVEVVNGCSMPHRERETDISLLIPSISIHPPLFSFRSPFFLSVPLSLCPCFVHIKRQRSWPIFTFCWLFVNKKKKKASSNSTQNKSYHTLIPPFLPSCLDVVAQQPIFRRTKTHWEGGGFISPTRHNYQFLRIPYCSANNSGSPWRRSSTAGCRSSSVACPGRDCCHDRCRCSGSHRLCPGTRQRSGPVNCAGDGGWVKEDKVEMTNEAWNADGINNDWNWRRCR